MTLGRDKIIIFGGNFSTLPPNTKNVKDFNDNECVNGMPITSDYSNESEWLRPFFSKFREVIPITEYQKNEHEFYTHTANRNGYWNKRLDYLFTNKSWKDGLIHQNSKKGGLETMHLSNHAPVTGTLILNLR